MPSEPAVLLDYMFELHINVLIEYSSIAILIFDYMLTFGKYVREVRYVWFNAPWNFGRVLYLLTRYLPFGGVFLTLFVDVTRGTSLSTCKILTQLAVYATVVDIIIAEIILMMRVWVIWARSRYISYALAATTIGLASVSIVTISTVPVSQDTFGADLNVTYGVCPPYFAGPNAGAITTCYMVLVCHESVLLVLTLIKAIDLYREWWKLYLSRNEHCSCDLNEGHLTGGTSNMINVFFADGLSYNAMILACSAANIIVRYRTAGTEYINLLASFQPVIHSVLTSRMMLNLRQDVMKSHASSRGDNVYSTRLPESRGGFSANSPSVGTLFDNSFSGMDQARSWFGEEWRRPEP